MSTEDAKDISLFVGSIVSTITGIFLILSGVSNIWSSIGILNIPSIMQALGMVFPWAYVYIFGGMVALSLGLRYTLSYRTVDAVSNNRLKIFGVLLALPVLVGASAVLALPDYELGENEQVAAESYNEMGAELGEALMELEGEQENIVYSPMSIGIAFSMVYAGADDEPKEELEDFLNIEVDEEVFHESNREILRSMGNPEPDYTYHRMFGLANDIETNLANGIWVNEGYSYKQDYADRMDEFYNARVREDSFDQSTVDKINGWINDETNGMIDDVLEGLDSSDVMVLVNAIYFYGDWMEEFDEDDTEEADFHLRDGSTVTVDMMEQSEEDFMYMQEGVNTGHGQRVESDEEDSLQAVRLPYGETGRFGMYVVLSDDIEEFVETFDQDEFERIQNEMVETEINLFMPKYEAEHDVRLDEVMEEEMGMEEIFDDSDNWDRMSEAVTAVDRAMHEAKVEVDEEGTEAAAATVVVMGTESAELTPTMRVDSPFMFVIADEKTGGILFQGIIQDPR